MQENILIKNDNNTPFVESSEGVGLSIITNKLQQQLSQDGIDMNEILKPTLSEKYAGYITGKVATMNKKNSHSMDLVEYKTSILSKLLSSIRNKLIGLQDKIFNRKLDNHKTEKAITAKSEKLPSWDLKNWSSEELEAYATWAKQQQTIKENLVEKEDDLYFKL